MAIDLNFNNIVDQFSERIYNHAYRMLGSRQDAEEATQDVFFKVYSGLNNFRGEAQLSTWIWRITTNVCLTRLARKPKHELLTDNGTLDEVTENDCDVNPAQLFIVQENREQLARLITKLAPRESAAITLFYFEEMNYKEISNILEIPMSSVATLLHRGREKLRAMILRSEGVKL